MWAPRSSDLIFELPPRSALFVGHETRTGPWQQLVPSSCRFSGRSVEKHAHVPGAHVLFTQIAPTSEPKLRSSCASHTFTGAVGRIFLPSGVALLPVWAGDSFPPLPAERSSPQPKIRLTLREGPAEARKAENPFNFYRGAGVAGASSAVRPYVFGLMYSEVERRAKKAATWRK